MPKSTQLNGPAFRARDRETMQSGPKDNESERASGRGPRRSLPATGAREPAGPKQPTTPKEPAGAKDPGTSVVTKVRPKTKRPNMYRVLILNDDYTPMEFVIHVLERFFNKSREDATRIMLHVHHHGVGECGVYTYEVAETKVTQVMDFARQHQHHLQCVMEKK
jgi:ATP-dependent Clp protease adaptor protein ClpS